MAESEHTVQGEARVISESTRPLNQAERDRAGIADEIREQQRQQEPRGVLRWLRFGRRASGGDANATDGPGAQHDREIDRLNKATAKLNARIDRMTAAADATLKRREDKAGVPPIDKQQEAQEIEAEL